MNKYPYNHDYRLRLSIGLNNCDREDAINPATSSSYSETEWDTLSDDEKQDWLNDELKEWVNGYIDASISVD